MQQSILQVILNTLSNILLYFVVLSYFFTFIFTMLFLLSKRILLGEISNIFFIISGIMHFILVLINLFEEIEFLFSSIFRAFLIIGMVIIAVYIIIELFYKIKMGGIFIVSILLIIFLYLLFIPKTDFDYFPQFQGFKRILHIIIFTGYFTFIGTYYNSFGIYLGLMGYAHIIKKNRKIYLAVSRRLDILALGGLIISVIARFLLLRRIEMLFFWQTLTAELLSVILMVMIIRGLFLYKKFDKKKGLLLFYKWLIAAVGFVMIIMNLKML